MRLGVVLEGVFHKSHDGRCWASPTLGNSFWERYLTVFEEVTIIARLREGREVPGQVELICGAGLTLSPVPYYRGPLQFALASRRVHKSVRESVRTCDAVIARVPSTLAVLAYPHARRQSGTLGLEVVGDPEDVFGRGSMGGLLNPVYRWLFAHSLRWMCRRADGVSYVTERNLQASYPPSRNALTTHYSSVELGSQDFAKHPRSTTASRPVGLIAVGSLDQLYKGPDVLLDALATIRDRMEISCLWVGGGRYLEAMRERACELDLRESVQFIGPVASREAMNNLLDAADVFVMPSRVEGLPRAMIEAMARGLPCIGTRVGGIPELLDNEALVEPESATELAHKILQLAANHEMRASQSQRNLLLAHRYAEQYLEPRRTRFYTGLRGAEPVIRAGKVR
jgi:glycosyltransferase involved in cell wall biosynthesis